MCTGLKLGEGRLLSQEKLVLTDLDYFMNREWTLETDCPDSNSGSATYYLSDLGQFVNFSLLSPLTSKVGIIVVLISLDCYKN